MTNSTLHSVPPRSRATLARSFGIAISLASAFASVRSLSAGDTNDAARGADSELDASDRWIEIMAAHAYSDVEMRTTLGISAEELAERRDRLGLPREGTTSVARRSPDGRLRILPYPGGRHPRIGFLEGAIDPWRETKLSVLLPWEDAGYVVVDLPEALWRERELYFLAHTHIPTVWDRRGVTLGRDDWEELPDGGLRNRFHLPDGALITAEARPTSDAVDLQLRLKNQTGRRLTGLRTQVCVLLRGAEGFSAQTNDNKVLESVEGISARPAGAAVKSADGDRTIATLWTRARPWANPPCPCVHSDPVFPDLDQGEEATVYGRIFFHEGSGLEAAMERHRRELAARATTAKPIAPRLVSVDRIWDRAAHSAFTDLIRHNDEWYCVFREGGGHVSVEGAIRVLASRDGRHWESRSVLRSTTADLRDPKICVQPDGRFLLTAAAALTQPSPIRHQTLAWHSADAKSWTEPAPIGDPNFWVWRVDWVREDLALGIGYGTTEKRGLRLYSSRDGDGFATRAETLLEAGYVNETSLAPQPDGSVLCVARRDPASAMLGSGVEPFDGASWTWRDLGVRLGGPKILRLPDGRHVVAGRRYDGRVRTSLAWLEPESARIEEFLSLPSGGDTSYPGLVYEAGLLWVSYYSSHEGKTSIYLARVDL